MRTVSHRLAEAIRASIVFVIVLGASPVQAAPEFSSAREFLLEGIARTSKILQAHDLPRQELSEKLRAEFRRGFDVLAIAGFAVGAAAGSMSLDQRRRYVSAFEELIVQTYTNRVFHLGPLLDDDIRDIIRVTGATSLSRGEILLHSEINRRKANWVKIDWRLRRHDEQFKILDIIILGISQAQVYRSEFASVIRRDGEGVDGLIQTIINKSEELRRQGCSGHICQ